MSQKWNLQDIKLPGQTRSKQTQSNRSKKTVTQTKKTSKPSKPLEQMSNIKIRKGKTGSGKKSLLLALGGGLGILLFTVLISNALGKTTLIVYPEFRDPIISSEFTATPQAVDGGLRYEVMTIEETTESQVQATGKVEVKEQANGTIEIQKSTPGSERLIKNTRFRSSSGLIFRVQESVVVPGASTNSAGETVPGTIRAGVFADDVGEDYNLAAGTTFDVPGFEEGGYTALYDSITAVNRQDFTGGFEGPQFQIDDSELSTVRQALQIELRDSLLEKVTPNKPAGMIAFPGAVSISYVNLPTVEYGNNLVTIREKATLQVPLFKNSELGSFLAKAAIPTYDRGLVNIEDAEELTFTYTDSEMNNSMLAGEQSLSFTLSGKPRLIWDYNSEKLTADLAGLPKTAVKNAITAYPGIEAAKADITPFWKRNFPEDPEKIIVVQELREE